MTALPPDFTHLHAHSHYSLLGGIGAPEELAARARADGLRALALADSNALFGAVAFARACRAEGIRPITGMTVSVAPPPGEMAPDTGNPLGRLVLLAAGPPGYRSLCRLSSLYQSDPDRGRRARGGFSWDELRDNTAGLIALSGGRTGWLERYLRAGQAAAATRYVSRLGGLYGEQLCLAVGPDLVTGHAPLVDEIVALAQRFGLRAAAVQPIFCLSPDDRPLLRLMAAIDANCRVEAVDPGQLPDGGDPDSPVEWPDPAAFAAAWANRPELLDAAGEVAAQCGEALPDGRAIWPSVGVSDPVRALREAAAAGMAARYGDPAPPAVVGRLAHETAVIAQSGFAPLFLVVADVVRFARAAGIPAGTRGSVANSLAAYCLGITTVDPVAHDLLFERFLNPARRNPPDIDLDFCSRRRDEILDYVRRTWGADRVALVSTINTFQPRSAVRETAKARGLPEAAINQLVAVLPHGRHPDPRRRSADGLAEAMAQLDDPSLRAVLREAWRLVGRPHHPGLHPGGVVITPGPLTDVAPLLLSPKGFLAVQYEHGDVEAIGLPKLDFLGIRALTVLADALELVNGADGLQIGHSDDNSGADILQNSPYEGGSGTEGGYDRQRVVQTRPYGGVDDIPTDDPATAAMLSAGETIGVFQCESDGARRTLRQLRARNVADLAIAGAFFKPGPALGGMARAFVRRYRGEERVTYLHPALEPILGRTKGVLIFQEQVLRLAVEVAGLDWGRADRLRRGISKFNAAEIDALAAEFVAGCGRPAPDGPAMTAEQATRLWEQIVPFAGYGFNQGHATAYAEVAWRMAWLKAHWPAEFLCARLADAGGFHHPEVYIAEARRLGIAVRPPHVNRSGEAFTLTYEPPETGFFPENTVSNQPILWMGLGAVRDLRRASVAAIVAERARAPFSGPADLMARAGLSPKETANLVRCGALDGLGANRAAMLDAAEAAGRAGGANQMRFDFLDGPTIAAESAADRLAWELEILGRPASVHPLELVARREDDTAVRALPQTRGRRVTALVVRIPGWPGGAGFFMSDGDDFAIARPAKALAEERTRWPAWQPLRLSGRWRVDEWGGGWFEVEAYEPD